MTVVLPAIKRCLELAKVAAKDVAHFCMPATLARVASTVAKAAGLDDKAVCDPLHANCGDTGAAHALVLLVATLEKAQAGDKILVVGFGQGADALLFEVTPEIAKRPKSLGVAGHLARRKEETSYGRFLAFNDLIELERGMRSETDKAHRALLAVAQSRDGDELHRRQVLQVRHAAVPEDRHLRQPQLQCHRHAGAASPSPTRPAASSPTPPTGSPTRPIRPRATA